MTWKNGRQLATLSNDNHSVSYSYDSNSVRVSKTVDGEKYTYEYLDGMLLYETRGEAKFWYSYDSNGILYNIRYTLSDDGEMMSYYCTHNSRGDIIGIYNGEGVLRAQYEYDSWGNVLSVTDENGNAITSATHVGNLNPFRYRGYYYDTESGFYYLMSRYYDPVTHRFINADGYFQAGNGILDANTFAYCANNPVMFSDQSGESLDVTIFYGLTAILSVSLTILDNITANDKKSSDTNAVVSAKYPITENPKEIAGIKITNYSYLTYSSNSTSQNNYIETVNNDIITHNIVGIADFNTSISDMAYINLSINIDNTTQTIGKGIDPNGTANHWETTIKFGNLSYTSGVEIYTPYETELAAAITVTCVAAIMCGVPEAVPGILAAYGAT